MSEDVMPLVSVCMPTYNDGDFVRQSLESIVRQTYPHLEILVSDDGSTDDTQNIVKSFVDARIMYSRNPSNLGQFENVNRTLQRAHGEFIAIYHSDDIYEPTIVEKEVGFLVTHPEAGAVFCRNKRIDDLGRVRGQTRLPPGVAGATCMGLEEVVRVLLRYKNGLLCGPSFMGRAEVLRKAGLFNTCDYEIAADLEMWLRILSAYPVAVLDEPLMRYRKGATQVSTRYTRLRTFEEHFFPIMDYYVAKYGLGGAMDRKTLTEYAFHRCDDETFRAANLVILGDPAGARELLQRPYPYRSLFAPFGRRKLRVLLLRAVMRAGLLLGAVRLLAKFLLWTEYGERTLGTARGA